MDNGLTDDRQRTEWDNGLVKMETKKEEQNKLLYADLTYRLIGFFFQINDLIGFGQTEKVYCASLEKLLKENHLNYEREYYCPIKLGDQFIAKRYFDFLIDNKIILEIKIGDYKYKEACSQVFGYLKQSGLKLGIIVRFTRNGVKIKRIPCFY